MRYSIIDERGNIVDRNLTYDEALLWIDGVVNGIYKVQIEKGDQNV